jgi:hypothetical protein
MSSNELTKEMEEWLKDVRMEEIARFSAQLERLEPLFNHAIVSATILYGMGALKALELRSDHLAMVLWLLFLTIGTIILILGFTFTLAYEYRWFDLIRIRLHLIQDFYDPQKAKGLSIKIEVNREDIEREYWLTDFPKEVIKLGNIEGIFKDFMNNDIATFKRFNWLEALIRLRTNERPIMSTWVAFGKQFIKGRRSLILFTLILLYPLLCFSLGAIRIEITVVIVFIIVSAYTLIQAILENYAPINRMR